MRVLIPFITAEIIDKGIEAGNMTKVYQYGALMLAIAFCSLMSGALAGKFAASASSGFACNLRDGMYENIQNYSFSNIDKYSTAGLVTRIDVYKRQPWRCTAAASGRRRRSRPPGPGLCPGHRASVPKTRRRRRPGRQPTGPPPRRWDRPSADSPGWYRRTGCSSGAPRGRRPAGVPWYKPCLLYTSRCV